MSVALGSRLGPYEIVSAIGAGGMGEVYRARDTRLERDVALKVLPAAFATDPERVARFRREARLLAALNHPQIAAIYGLEETDPSGSGHVALCALVLELVEGPTLADRLAAGRLPARDAIAIAAQIADALDAAHQKGIIHRDLKPENVKVSSTGVVKVLDFGLAKALVGEGGDADPSRAPTLTGANTRDGLILGTPGYMSPEQARGQPVDKRTDVWAFGCVLFEMLTGAPAFTRETVTDTIAAIVGAEPEWKMLPADTVAGVRRLLARCLQKDARRRLHDIADARIELEDSMAAPAGPTTAPTPQRWSRMMALLALSLGVATVLVFVWLALGRFGMTTEPSAPGTRVTRLTDLPGLEEDPAISPDGKSVAFTAGVGGKRHLFVQLVAGGAPLQLTRDSVDHEFARWSPDSSSIVYFSPAASGETEGTLSQISALGGPARRITNSVGGADVNLTDGRLAFFRLPDQRMQLVRARRMVPALRWSRSLSRSLTTCIPVGRPMGNGSPSSVETASGSMCSSPRLGEANRGS